MTAKKIFICVFLSGLAFSTVAQSNKNFKAIFQKFQEGYAKRDTSKVEAFANELCTKDVQIIGTGDEEWLQGINSAKTLFKNDWLYWFGLSLDTSTLHVTTTGNAAFFRIKGTAFMTFPNKEAAYDFAYNRLQQMVENEKTKRAKLLSYSSEAADMIQQIESGSLEIKYSIRISGGLIEQNGRWLFQQLVFSFPYPMTRK
jgi:hypothetical protein